MTAHFRPALCLAGLLVAFGCQPATSPGAPAGPAPAVAPIGTPRVDLGHPDGGAIAVQFTFPAPTGRRVQAWASDIKAIVLEVKSAALKVGTHGVTKAGELVVEVAQPDSGRCGATLLNLPASDVNANTRYDVRVKVLDRAGNNVTEGARPDGFVSVATQLVVDPHQVTFVPNVPLALTKSFALAPVTPTPAPTPKDKPGGGPK